MFLIEAPIADEFDFHFQMEEKVTIHFENVSFVSDGKIDVGLNGIATFYRCQFANGKQVDNNFNFTQFDKKSTLTFPKLTLNRPVFSSVSGLGDPKSVCILARSTTVRDLVFSLKAKVPYLTLTIVK